MMVKRMIEQSCCDVCGELADGDFSFNLIVNGQEYNSTHCELDLCKMHMEIFAEFYMHYGITGKKYKYVKATHEYIGLTSNEKTEMIEDIKNKSNEVHLALNKVIEEYENGRL